MSDIVERLREGRTDGTHLRWTVTDIHIEAADIIESLQAELAQARNAALEEAAKLIEEGGFDPNIRLDVKKHTHIGDWFRDQQAAAIRSLREEAGQ